MDGLFGTLSAKADMRIPCGNEDFSRTLTGEGGYRSDDAR
jgi:hypothetical protein